jgi:hypothetical protein
MTMRKHLILAITLFVAGEIAAQTPDDLSKQLEVTRAYTPRVGQADKLPIDVDMTDTVRLRPEISYSITSTASETSMITRQFEAATVSAEPLRAKGPLYIRAGAGAPLVSELDIYYTPDMGAGGTFGIYANHEGSFSRITNDLGIEANATEMTNGAGVWGTGQWKRYSLRADATYDTRLYNPYGVADVSHDPSSRLHVRRFVYDKYMHRFSLGLARAGVSFGDNFTDLSRFNFRIGIDGGYAHSGNGPDQTNLDLGFMAAKMFGSGRHGFELVLAEKGAFGPAMDYLAGDSDAMQRGNAVTVTLAPRYLLASGVWSLRAGIDVRYVDNKMYDQGYVGFAPSLEVRANIADGAFVPFASYTSQTIEGDPEALSRRNPYVVTGGTTAWIDDARIGFEGDLGDVFSYKLSGGASMFDDYQLFVGTQVATPRDIPDATAVDYPPMWFSARAVSGTRFTAGAEIALHNLGGFGARFYGNWNRFKFRGLYDFTPVGDLPNYDAGTELSYRYKDIFSIRLGGQMIGEREYLVHSGQHYTPGKIAPVMDISFGADVRIVPDFWVFLEGDNLANQELYPYPHYRGLGTSILGGVKIVF